MWKIWWGKHQNIKNVWWTGRNTHRFITKSSSRSNAIFTLSPVTALVSIYGKLYFSAKLLALASDMTRWRSISFLFPTKTTSGVSQYAWTLFFLWVISVEKEIYYIEEEKRNPFEQLKNVWRTTLSCSIQYITSKNDFSFVKSKTSRKPTASR